MENLLKEKKQIEHDIKEILMSFYMKYAFMDTTINVDIKRVELNSGREFPVNLNVIVKFTI